MFQADFGIKALLHPILSFASFYFGMRCALDRNWLGFAMNAAVLCLLIGIVLKKRNVLRTNVELTGAINILSPIALGVTCLTITNDAGMRLSFLAMPFFIFAGIVSTTEIRNLWRNRNHANKTE